MGMRSQGGLKGTRGVCHVIGAWQVSTHSIVRPRPRLCQLGAMVNFLLPFTGASIPYKPLPLAPALHLLSGGSELSKQQDAVLFQALA